MSGMKTTEDPVRDVVDLKVRRALGSKVLPQIRTPVNLFEMEERQRHRACLYAVLALILFLLAAMPVTSWPALSRVVTGLLT